jgi:phospholipid transport system substrate-binding protein
MHLLRSIRVLLLPVAFACLAPAITRADAASDAKAALSLGIDEVASALRERPAASDLVNLLDTLVDKHFAFATTTRLAVGPAWRDFTPEQQNRAIYLFSRIVIRTYVDRIDGDTGPRVNYGQPVELRAGRVEVPTTAVTGGQTYSVTYRLELDKASASARWRVYDVVAEGVSLIANYRSQFDPIVKKSGPVGLLETLEIKLAEQASSPKK